MTLGEYWEYYSFGGRWRVRWVTRKASLKRRGDMHGHKPVEQCPLISEANVLLGFFALEFSLITRQSRRTSSV